MNYDLNRTTEATAELFTLAEVKNFLKIPTENTTDDSLLGGSDEKGGLIEASRMAVQNLINRSTINEIWTMWLHEQPDLIYLPKGKIQSVSSVTTYQVDGSTTAESSTTTYDTQTGEYGYVLLRENASWTASDRTRRIMAVVYTAGYGTASTSVPPAIITAAYEILSLMYYHRSMTVQIPEQVYAWLRPYRTRLI